MYMQQCETEATTAALGTSETIDTAAVQNLSQYQIDWQQH